MQSRRLALVAFVLCGVAGASQVDGSRQQNTATPGISVAPSRLDADRRLDRAITIEPRVVSLTDLLAGQSGGGVTLSCGRSCAGQCVQVRLKARPLRVVMKALAD